MGRPTMEAGQPFTSCVLCFYRLALVGRVVIPFFLNLDSCLV